MAQDYLGDHMSAMDRGYYAVLDSFGTIYHPVALHEHDDGAKTGLMPMEVGQSANPFQNQLQSLQARIRAGASSVEISFGGVGKGNSQQGTPEMYGRDEREAMRTLAEYNDVKTSTHASFGMSGLAGFGQNGFSKEAQHRNMEEVRKAVDFASQATTGGAVVVHAGEWQRAMSEQDWAKRDFSNIFGDKPAFKTHAEEEKRAVLPVVDSRTGNIIGGIRKDQEIYEPKWITAKEYEKYSGKKLPYVDMQGNRIKKYNDGDYVDVDGKRIDADKTEELFRRMPHWDTENTRFETQKLDWDALVRRTKQYNENHGEQKGFKPLSPEQMYAKIELDNQILQSRGSSLFHGQHYDDYKKRRDKLQRAYEFVKKLDKGLPETEKWQLLRTSHDPYLREFSEFIPPETESVVDSLRDQLDQYEKQMRHIHESSAAADTQAKTLLARRDNIQTMEEYGLNQSGQALGQLGVYAMEKSTEMRQKVKTQGGDLHKYKDIYIAPENVFPGEYGSHPDELIKIVEAGREKMAKELHDMRGMSLDKAKQEAAKHIKSTIDIGHLNMWKTHMVRKPDETEAQFSKRFEGWAMQKLEQMHKKGILGHFHLADNMGFNDEHLTPGQGNAPIRSFVKRLEELGYNDFIVEQSGTNDATIMGETWSYLGVLGFKPGMQGSFAPRFTDVHWRHAGGYAPPNYMVGSYVPSNEWTLWSQVPLE